jgi:hypothetical protein
MSETELPNIVQGETRTFEITPDPSLSAGYEARNYRFAVARTSNPTVLLSVNFGPSEYSSATGKWEVTLTSVQTASLPIGGVTIGIWEIGRPEPVARLRASVGRVPGAP